MCIIFVLLIVGYRFDDGINLAKDEGNSSHNKILIVCFIIMNKCAKYK